MATTSPLQGFRLPTPTDDPDVVDDMTNLALDIEKRVVGVYVDVSDRNTKVSSPQDGQVALLKSTHTITMFNGSTSTWITIYPQPIPTFSSGATVPSNSSGNDGDVFYKV